MGTSVSPAVFVLVGSTSDDQILALHMRLITSDTTSAGGRVTSAPFSSSSVQEVQSESKDSSVA